MGGKKKGLAVVCLFKAGEVPAAGSAPGHAEFSWHKRVERAFWCGGEMSSGGER